MPSTIKHYTTRPKVPTNLHAWQVDAQPTLTHLPPTSHQHPIGPRRSRWGNCLFLAENGNSASPPKFSRRPRHPSLSPSSPSSTRLFRHHTQPTFASRRILDSFYVSWQNASLRSRRAPGEAPKGRYRRRQRNLQHQCFAHFCSLQGKDMTIALHI